MWNLDVTNIAGIRSGEATLERGVNVVQATNWQGKSSLLAAIQTVAGTTGLNGDSHPLTEGASEGRVELTTDDRTYETVLRRESGDVVRRGETLLADETDRVCARLFAFLGEDNPVRAAVRNDGDLASLLCRPLDIEDIDDRIARLQAERSRLETDIDRVERATNELPQVREAITQLEDDLEALRERRDDLREEIDESSDDVRDRLSEARADRERVEATIERVENKIARKESRLEEARAELDDLDLSEPDHDVDLDARRDRMQELDAQLDLLEDLYRVNKRVLDEGQLDLVTDVERTIAGDEVACWVCGAEVSESTLADRLDALRERLESLREERDELESTVERARERREELERNRRRADQLETDIAELEAEIRDHRQTLDRKRERLESLEETVSELESKLQSQPDADALADVESELTVTERELERKRERLEDLQSEADRLERLRSEREDLADRIADLRERKRTKQFELKEQFDAAMAEVIETFEPGFEDARLDPKVDGEGNVEDFELVVARDGRRTTRDALSEGELELLGIVTALAGYKTFDVADRVPAFLLDGIGALASTHVHGLVDYLRDDVPYLVTTAYPEAGEFEGHTISPATWEVVSDRPMSSDGPARF